MASSRARRPLDSSDRRDHAVTDADWRAALGIDYELVDALPSPWREPRDVPGLELLGRATQDRRCERAHEVGRMERKKFKIIGRHQAFYAYRPAT